MARHPVALRVVDSCEGIAVGLLLAQVCTDCFRITIARKGSVGAGGISDPINSVAAIPLQKEPLTECHRSLVVAVVCHKEISMWMRLRATASMFPKCSVLISWMSRSPFGIDNAARSEPVTLANCYSKARTFSSNPVLIVPRPLHRHHCERGEGEPPALMFFPITAILGKKNLAREGGAR